MRGPARNPVGHVESGLRSFDRTMPEEINRVVTDHLSELLFLHSPEAEDNLRAEGIPEQRFEFVGNTMIDTLVALEHRFREREAAAAAGVEPGSYLLVTLHRPALVDGPLLDEAIAALAESRPRCRSSSRSTRGRARCSAAHGAGPGR